MRLNNFVLFACSIVLVVFVPLALTSASEPITHLTSLDVPPGKVYVYKHSAGRPRQMEIYFPPGHDTTTAKVPGLILFHGGGLLFLSNPMISSGRRPPSTFNAQRDIAFNERF